MLTIENYQRFYPNRFKETQQKAVNLATFLNVYVRGKRAEDLRVGDKFKPYAQTSNPVWEVVTPPEIHNNKVFVDVRSTKTGMIKTKVFNVGQTIGNWRDQKCH